MDKKEEIKPIAIVINNNQKGWKNIIETKPYITLPIGKELYTNEQLSQAKSESVQELVHELEKIRKNLDSGLSSYEIDSESISEYVADSINMIDELQQKYLSKNINRPLSEIKFRAYHKGLRQMSETIWEPTSEKSFVFYDSKAEKIEFHEGEDLNDLILMQFTGIKDFKNKDMYEADIVKRGSEVGVIQWDSLEARFRIYLNYNNPRSVNYPVNRYLKFQVLGNLYENPELLLMQKNK